MRNYEQILSFTGNGSMNWWCVFVGGFVCFCFFSLMPICCLASEVSCISVVVILNIRDPKVQLHCFKRVAHNSLFSGALCQVRQPSFNELTIMAKFFSPTAFLVA